MGCSSATFSGYAASIRRVGVYGKDTMKMDLPIICLLASAVVSGDALAGARNFEKLVPAIYRQETDDDGNEWNFQQNGVLGRTTDSLISGAHLLQINNNQFYNYQPLMTEDGVEYVLDNKQQNIGIDIVRRVQLVKKDGVVRYLEIFKNSSPTVSNLAVELRSNLGGRFKEFYSDRGRRNPTTLEEKESGLVIIPKNKGPKAVIYTLASPKGSLKPTITHQNEYQLNAQFQVTIPPGQTVVLIHTVRQVPVPDKFDAKTLSRLFRQSGFSRYVKTVPADLRPYLANYIDGRAFGGASLLETTSIDGLGVERARTDVLAMGERTRLLGGASCGRLSLEGDYGRAEIPFEEVDALVGEGYNGSRGGRVFLKDGQVISGKLEVEDLRFVMPNGASIELSGEGLDRLVRGESGDTKRAGRSSSALLETYQGDRLAIVDDGLLTMGCVTPWGAIRFGLDEILWLSPPEEEPVGHHIEFKDGSRFFAFLTGSEVSFKTKLFGMQTLDSQRVRSIVTAGAFTRQKKLSAEMSGDPVAQQPHILLSGSQRMIGRIDAPVIGVITNAKLIELPPDTVRRMRSLREDGDGIAGDSAPFEILLWGGSVITGHLSEAVLPVRVRSEVWQVPVGDVLEVITPHPQISDVSRHKVASLIRDLGDDDWRKRDNASAELAEYGYLAKPLLEESLKVNPDPEVARRVEKLLAEMDYR